ncbi:DnaB-like helicase N-terminal domain-containing protein [Streptomyces sp. NPDC092952]|uniref:DnaB-like helicase N-terminal domain-containing protein n=1 Tax=Streptomyces sp. NPDC092952 TaxID=3366018 RepID=UPI00380620E9
MPPVPTPDEEGDLDSVPSPRPVFHAEQALLGALLLQPHHRDNVNGIAAAAFSTAAHRSVFAAISTLPLPAPAEHAKTATWLSQVLTRARQEVHGLSPVYLHTLIRACPQPDHAPAYARMVQGEHARRRLEGGAERLVRAAHDTALPDPVRAVLAEADALNAIVDNVAALFPPRSGTLPRTPAPSPVLFPDHAQAVEEEQLLLASATARPAAVESARWLLPADFLRPLHAGLWQCLSAMVRRHEPVDPVTVLWEAQQRGLLDGGTEPAEVLGLLAGPYGAVDYWAERAVRRSLLATAVRVGSSIEAYARDPTASPFQLVVGARRALADLGSVRTRWRHATEPIPSARSRPVPPARAGPPTTMTGRSTRGVR